MSKFANWHRRPSEINVGNEVYLKIRPHKQKSMPIRVNPKLFARYYGPFKMTAQIGQVAYRLQLPEGALIHPVFHVSLLKKAIGNANVESEWPVSLQGRGKLKVYHRRKFKKKNKVGGKVVSVIRLGKVGLFYETNLESWGQFLDIVWLTGVTLCERNSGSSVPYSVYFLWWNYSINKTYSV